MAHIICRYTIPYCAEQGKELGDCYSWMCDSDFECMVGSYTPDERDLQRHIVNPTCAHLKFLYREFEKTVKNYEYDENFFSLKGLIIDNRFIEHLEIDGRVLINEEDEE